MSTQRQVNPWIVAIAVMFATFMEVLDTTVVNVSLPHIAGSLSSTIDEAAYDACRAAAAGLAVYVTHANVDWGTAVAVGIASVFSAGLGARLAARREGLGENRRLGKTRTRRGHAPEPREMRRKMPRAATAHGKASHRDALRINRVLRPHRSERGGHGLAVTGPLHLGEARQLLVLVLRSDEQEVGRRVLVALGEVVHADDEMTVDVDAVSGAVMLMRTDALHRVGEILTAAMHGDDHVGIHLLQLPHDLVEIGIGRGAEMEAADERVNFPDARDLLRGLHRVENAGVAA